MRYSKPSRLCLLVSLIWITGCSSTPDLSRAEAPRQHQQPADLPASVMETPVPDFEVWMDRILSSSMARLGMSSPSSSSAPAVLAKP